ncbi:MAG TPA: hypothetical protein PLH46_04305 [Caldisericia bacterium]|nr:hypothetical protein [Caldisericia bacterium]
MKPASKFVSFENLTYEEKKEAIYINLAKVSSEEFLNRLIEENEIEISDGLRYKNCIGCPVVYMGKPQEVENKNGKDKAKGREVFRELNSRFPLLRLMGIIENKFNREKYPLDNLKSLD